MGLVCRSCQSEISSGAKFCSNCGAKIESVDQTKVHEAAVSYAERKQITVLFSDLAGSTHLSEILDPEDMREILGDYQSVCTSIIKRYDGFVAKFLGDGILAYFGYPQAHEDDPLRGVRAGLGIVEAMKTYSAKYQKKFGVETNVRIGIHTGLVVVGDMGASDEHESDAIVGKTPNLAARIQSESQLNTVSISIDTFKLLRGFFECADMGDRQLKGFANPVHLYQVLHERTGASRFDTISDDLTPLAGREDELKTLQIGWEKAETGIGSVVVIEGEAGIGKSRIVHSIKEYISTQKNAWLTEVHCSQYYTNSSFFPIIEMIENVVLNFTPDENSQDKLEKIVGWTAQLGFDESFVPLFASLLSVPVPDDYPSLNLTPVKQKEKTIELLISIMLNRSLQQPVLFIVEDLHWADPSTLELLEKFIERVSDSHILSVFTKRPESDINWYEKPTVSLMDLTRLPKNDAKKIISEIVGERQIPQDVINYILKKTDGIPLFLEELTLMMVDTKMLTEKNGNFVLSSPLENLPIPNSLNDLLAAKLDRMKEAKPVAQLAAAIGREFTYSMIDSIPGQHRNELNKKLDKLMEAGLLYRKGVKTDGEYVFKHALIQDSAYNSLLKSSRRNIHKSIAESFVHNRSDIVDAQPELIAYHYSEAKDSENAMGYWQKAGELAIRRSAMPEAISHLSKAVTESSNLPEGPERIGGELMAQTYLGLANTQAWGYGHEDVEKSFNRARELCSIMGDPPQIFPVLHGLVKFRLVRGEYTVGLELARQLQETAEKTGDENLLIEALYVVGAAQFWMGDADASISNFESLNNLYDPEAHRDHAMIYGEDPCIVALSHNLWQRAICGMFEESQNDLAKVEKLVDELNHPWSTDYLHTCRTHMYAALNDYENTEKYAIAFRDSAIDHGFPWWIAAASVNVGWAIAQRGEVEEGLDMAIKNVELWRMMGAELAAPNFYLRIAEIHLLNNDPNKALNALNTALSIIEKTKEGLYEAEIHRVKGIVYAKLNKEEKGLNEISKAIELSKNRNQKLWLIRAAASHVELSDKLGKEQTKFNTLKDTFNWLNKDHGIKDLVRANKLLTKIK